MARTGGAHRGTDGGVPRRRTVQRVKRRRARRGFGSSSSRRCPMTATVSRLALLWRGDREARANATPANNRYYRIFEELAARSIHAEPAVYSEEMEDEVRAQLLGVDGV